MKRHMKAMCIVALLAPLAFTACKKNEKPLAEDKPLKTTGRIIEPVNVTDAHLTAIPLKPGDSVRQTFIAKPGRKSSPTVQAICKPSFDVIGTLGWQEIVQATVCFSVYPEQTDWYIMDGNGWEAYIVTTGQGVLSIPPFYTNLDCGKSYYVQARYYYYDAANIVRLGLDNSAWSWTAGIVQVEGLGVVDDGADVKITDINGNNIPDIVLMTYDDAPGGNNFKYKILKDVNSNGTSSNVTSTVTVAGVGADGNGGGVVIEDINGNGIKDMILMAYDDPSGANTFRYKVGLDLDANGVATSWSSSFYSVAGLGDIAHGAGIAMWDIDKNGVKDIIVMAYVDNPGANDFRYRIGWNPNSSGVTSSWSGVTYITGAGTIGQGAGLDIKDVDGNGNPEFFFLAYDDAPGENAFKYRVVHNVNTSGTGTVNPNLVTYRGVGDDGMGAGIALGDLNNDGNLDIILMADDNTPGNATNNFRYRIGYNLPAGGGIQPSYFWCPF